MSAPSTTPQAKRTPEALTIKAELQVAAAMLTAAVIGKMNVQVAADPTVKDPGLQQLNLTAAALHKVFYAFCDAAENNTGVDPDGTINGWADPILPAPSAPPAPAPGGSTAASSVAQLAAAVMQTLQPAITQAVQNAVAGLGQTKTAAPASPAPAQQLGS